MKDWNFNDIAHHAAAAASASSQPPPQCGRRRSAPSPTLTGGNMYRIRSVSTVVGILTAVIALCIYSLTPSPKIPIGGNFIDRFLYITQNGSFFLLIIAILILFSSVIRG